MSRKRIIKVPQVIDITDDFQPPAFPKNPTPAPPAPTPLRNVVNSNNTSLMVNEDDDDQPVLLLPRHKRYTASVAIREEQRRKLLKQREELDSRLTARCHYIAPGLLERLQNRQQPSADWLGRPLHIVSGRPVVADDAVLTIPRFVVSSPSATSPRFIPAASPANAPAPASVSTPILPSEWKDEPSADKDCKQLCIVCQDRAVSTTIIDCGHMCLCVTCTLQLASANNSKQQARCPVCRTPLLRGVVRTYSAGTG